MVRAGIWTDIPHLAFQWPSPRLHYRVSMGRLKRSDTVVNPISSAWRPTRRSRAAAFTVAVVTGDIPQNINFAIRAELAKLFLTKHSVDFEIEMNQTRLEPSVLAEDAKKYTVVISCWDG